MAREKFVVRLLDDGHELLAWAEVYAEPKPQARGASCPYWPVIPTKFDVEKHGVATLLTVHWCDLDVARMNRLLEPVMVRKGDSFNFTWMEPVWLVGGMAGVPLPATTSKGDIAITVPPAQLGLVGHV